MIFRRLITEANEINGAGPGVKREPLKKGKAMSGNKQTVKQKRALALLEATAKRYQGQGPSLDWGDAWQLLVATVLSAQCTDARVNLVTPELFRRWPTAEALKDADRAELEEVIRSTGFFRHKAKNLQASAALVHEKWQGMPPRTMEELITLPGVARKTANIVLAHAYGVQAGIAVDTHVARIARRMGLTRSDNPLVIERDLLALFPEDRWGEVNMHLVRFGREVCPARTPKCGECELAEICPKIGVSPKITKARDGKVAKPGK